MTVVNKLTVSTNSADLSIDELQARYANGQLTTEQFVNDCLARLKAYDGIYKACIALNPKAVEEAKTLDRRRACGETLGVLAGIPIVIKDSIDVAGLPTTAGWSALSKHTGGIDLIPECDAPVVQRLREADAIIIGKGNIPAFSLSSENTESSWAGATVNAVDSDLIPGGSSSGVATAVSAQFSVLGLAEETGGSIQNPAAAQAIVGIKPTFGLVPNTGAFPLAASTLDVMGPHAKSVRDAAIMLGVIAGYSITDPKTVAAIGNVPPSGSYSANLTVKGLQGKRIGLYGLGWSGRGLSPETNSLYRAAVNTIKRMDAIAVDDPFADTDFHHLSPVDEWKQNFYGLESLAFDIDRYLSYTNFECQIDSLKNLTERVGEDPLGQGGLLEDIWKAINYESLSSDGRQRHDIYSQSQSVFQEEIESIKTPLASVKAPNLASFAAIQNKYLHLFNQIMDKNNLDGLFFPQLYQEIPSVRDQSPYPVIATPQINILGLPGVVVPGGYYQSGSPFSVIFIGRRWREAQLLTMAYAYEQATQHRTAPSLNS